MATRRLEASRDILLAISLLPQGSLIPEVRRTLHQISEVATMTTVARNSTPSILQMVTIIAVSRHQMGTRETTEDRLQEPTLLNMPRELRHKWHRLLHDSARR